MSDYTYYIDNNAIQLGDLAYSIGDFKCAFDNYNKALNRLRKYQGDRMAPMMIASGLVKKVNETSNLVHGGTSTLKFDPWKLSKTSFVKGKQCLKHLYLDKHKKQYKTPISEEKKQLFKKGHTFEDTVRNTAFPNGINIKETVGFNFGYFNSYTKFLLQNYQEQVLYEATIIEDEVLVMCDVLVQHKNGKIDVYEIKLHTQVNEAVLADLALQYAICKKRFGSNLNSFNLILRAPGKTPNWKIENVTDNLEPQIPHVDEKIKEYKTVLWGKEPNVGMGTHCQTPYECDFIDYCKKVRNQ
ncbi:hypothetical protein K8354_13075 [Polaribacter litorisediminis]|uniref:hypothetical protein n=1 Tax=Polaribacter litorisediminis TaxID=1908341 RepID=UPI001CBBC558|nr:hypothetical protein [Polaribacter litorisediminis]UAM97245.1 hypothetical protein K8354_13075 [Polaribacter litorisediminis]